MESGLLSAADIGKGKHVAKTKLAAAVEGDCLQAGILIGGVISPRDTSAPLSLEWEKARQVIARLGDATRYPGREEFADWVVEKALPALRFVVHGTPLSGEGPGTDEGQGTSVGDHGDSHPTADASNERSIIAADDMVETDLPNVRLSLVSAPVLAPEESNISLVGPKTETITAE